MRRLASRREIHEIGVDVDADIFRGVELGAIFLAEAGDGAAETKSRGTRSSAASGMMSGGPIGGQVQDRRCLVGIGIEVGLSDRPAAQGMMRLRIEIIRVERARPAAPVIRATAEEAQARRFQRIVRLSCCLALVEFLRFGLELEPARLEQADRSPAGCKPPRQSHACRPGADHADIENPVAEPVVGARLRVEDQCAGETYEVVEAEHPPVMEKQPPRFLLLRGCRGRCGGRG